MYQQITIVGHLGSSPEMRYTPSGVPVTNFSVATSRRWTDAEGAKQEKTTWFRVTAWRELATLCEQYLAKGRQVMVVSELTEPTVYTAKDGTLRASLDVTARSVTFLGAKDDAQPKTIDTPVLAEEPAIPF